MNNVWMGTTKVAKMTNLVKVTDLRKCHYTMTFFFKFSATAMFVLPKFDERL